MKRVKLDTGKLQFKKQKIATLTNDEMSRIIGGDIPSGVTNDNCCLQTAPERGSECAPYSDDFTVCTATCAAGNCNQGPGYTNMIQCGVTVANCNPSAVGCVW